MRFIEQTGARRPARRLLAIAPLLLALLAPGCKKREKPDLHAPINWSGHGLSFQYPGNWTISDDLDRGDGIEIVTVDIESKGTWDSSSAMIQTFEPALPATFDVLAKQYLGGLPEALGESGMSDVKVVDEQPARYAILGAERTGKRMHLRGRIDGEERDIVSELHVVEQDNRTVIIQTQAPLGELEAASSVFTMLRSTLATGP